MSFCSERVICRKKRLHRKRTETESDPNNGPRRHVIEPDPTIYYITRKMKGKEGSSTGRGRVEHFPHVDQREHYDRAEERADLDECSAPEETSFALFSISQQIGKN